MKVESFAKKYPILNTIIIIVERTLKEEFVCQKRHDENSDLSERYRLDFHRRRPAHTIGLPTRSLSKHNGTSIRGHEGTIHTAAHSRHCSLCALLGSGRHDPTLVRRHQRVAGEAWRVRATSGAGASELALLRSLRCDLVFCCFVMSYIFGHDFVNHRRYTAKRSLKPPPPPPPKPHGRRRRRRRCCAAAAVLWLRFVSPAFVSKTFSKKLSVLLLW